MEFAKRFKVEEVWPAELIAKKPEFKGKTLFDVLYAQRRGQQVPGADLSRVNGTYIEGYSNDEAEAFGFYVQKGLFEEYAEFGRGHGHDLAPFDVYHKARGLRWPVVDGKETLWRFREGLRPVREGWRGRAVLRLQGWQGQHLRAALPARRREPRTRTTTCGCAPAACWSTGTPAR